MPEISDSEYRVFLAFQALNMSPVELQRKINDLERDNKVQRDEIRELKENAPEEGQVLVAKDDVEQLKKYRELGKPDELTGKLEAGTEAQQKLALARAREQASTFATAAGLAPEAVDTLIAIPALKDATFEVRETKDGDKVVKVPYITLAGEGQKAMKYEDAMERVPSLKGLRPATPEEQNGRGFVQQGPPGGPKGGQDNVFDKIREEAKARKEASKSMDSITEKARTALGVAGS